MSVVRSFVLYSFLYFALAFFRSFVISLVVLRYLFWRSFVLSFVIYVFLSLVRSLFRPFGFVFSYFVLSLVRYLFLLLVISCCSRLFISLVCFIPPVCYFVR